MKHIKTILTGFLTGIANGIFGSGGGTIAVPAMEKFLSVEPHKSHATAIALILPLSIVSAVFYIFKTEIPWKIILFAAIGSTAGGITGAKLLVKVKVKHLHKIFAVFMFAAAVRMIL